jgi:hypothetical protein
MANRLIIEDIEAMRRYAGIDDVALRDEIRTLKIGDFVKVSLSTSKGRFETLRVRITSIKGSTMRGRLTDAPTSGSATTVRQGALLAFTAAHIHSIPKERRT